MLRYVVRASVVIAALTISLISTRAALAAPIFPGGLNVLSGSSYPSTVVQDTVRIVPLLSFGTEIGTVELHDRVTATGPTVNFERFFVNTGNTTLSSPTLTSSGFSGYSTDVDYDPTSPGVSHPLIALRSAGVGNDITFDKFNAFSIAPGEQTNLMTEKTNAAGYAPIGTTTITGIVNGQYVTGSITTYAPSVPEPTTLSLLGLGALGLLARRRRA